MRANQISMIVLTAALSLGFGSAAQGNGLVLKRDSGATALGAATSNSGPAAGATKLGAPKSDKADLVIVPFYNNPDNLPEGFPTESYCAKKPSGGAPNQIKFYIRNQGGAPSGNFTWVPMFLTAGYSPGIIQVSIGPGQQKLITQNIPAGCYSPGFSGSCPFTINLDSLKQVVEANESNNQDNSHCVSPAG